MFDFRITKQIKKTNTATSYFSYEFHEECDNRNTFTKTIMIYKNNSDKENVEPILSE